MTPEERAEAITRNWKSIEVGCTPLSSQVALTSCHIGGDMVPIVTEQITNAIREAADAARAEERERICQLLLGGSFLHDDAPAARLAREAVAAIRREPTR